MLNNPVRGASFVGRDDILRELEELWAKQGQVPSVVIYGHRRMGKSSILQNLGPRFGTSTTVVDFNMQRVGLVDHTSDLIYNLALALYDSLPPAQQAALGEPDAAQFKEQDYKTVFDRYLKALDNMRDGQRFIVALDEFEAIEENIEKGKLDPRLLTYWRGLIQTYPWFVMAFAGLHTLEEMASDYWNPLFSSVRPILVSFLSHGAARRLLTQPSDDFDIDYDEDAIARVLALTNGQPFLVQLIGHTLVNRFNRQSYEEGIERARRFSCADVDAIIAAPEFYRSSNAYFTGVWQQAERSDPAGQTTVLRALCNGPQAAQAVAAATGLDEAQADAALATLARHDVVVLRERQYGYTIELMRRWVARHEQLDSPASTLR